LVAHKDQIEFSARAMRTIAQAQILCVPGNQQASVQDRVEAAGASQSNIFQRVATLREKNIPRSRRDVNRVFYSVSGQRTLNLIGVMREVFGGTRTRS
jgi:hypothetical protein